MRARMGLHTGEPTLTSSGYVGLDVHRAARIVLLDTVGRPSSPRPRVPSSSTTCRQE